MKKTLVFLFLITPSAFALELNGTFEYLFCDIAPNNQFFLEGLLQQRYYGYNELKIILDDNKTNRFYIEDRIRHDFTNNVLYNHLEQAYILIRPADFFYFKLGKQRIDFGIGYLWSAVNNIDKPKDVYNPRKYIFGVDGIKTNFELTLSANLPVDVSFCVVLTTSVFYSDLSKAKFGLQTYTLVNNLELGLVSNYSKLSSNDLLIGAYFSYDIKGFILGLEYSINFLNNENFSTVLLNLNKKISQKSFLIAEYFYNEKGYNKEKIEQFRQIINSSHDYITFSNLFVPGYFSKNYLLVDFNYEPWYDIFFGITILANLDSFGMFLYPKLSYGRLENVTLSLEFIRNFYNEDKNEFYFLPYSHMYLLRATYYF